MDTTATEAATGGGVWLTMGGEADEALARTLESRVAQRISAGAYSIDNVKYIAKMHLWLCTSTLSVSDETLEKLRRLCQLWDVDVRVREISSHRKFVGPVIVAVKKILFPIVRVLLKDFIRQQRSFNAAAIAVLADVANRKREECAPGGGE